MTRVQISLPDQTKSEIDRLVEQGEFISRDQAIEELLSKGISAYQTTEEISEEPQPDEEMFSQMTEEQQDPAMQDEERGDDYTF